MDDAGKVAGWVFELGGDVIYLVSLVGVGRVSNRLTYIVPTVEGPEPGVECHCPVANVFARVIEPAAILPVLIRIALV